MVDAVLTEQVALNSSNNAAQIFRNHGVITSGRHQIDQLQKLGAVHKLAALATFQDL